jgi:CheY-specific phosphatase CheX
MREESTSSGPERGVAVNAAYIRPVLTAVDKLFATMIGMSASAGKPAFKKDKQPSHDITSRIDLSGAMSGAICVSMSRALSLVVSSRLLGEDKTALDTDCMDAIKEFANMIVGNAKSEFPDDRIVITPPTLHLEPAGDIYPQGVMVVSVPFQTPGGSFTVDLALKAGG